MTPTCACLCGLSVVALDTARLVAVPAVPAWALVVSAALERCFFRLSMFCFAASAGLKRLGTGSWFWWFVCLFACLFVCLEGGRPGRTDGRLTWMMATGASCHWHATAVSGQNKKPSGADSRQPAPQVPSHAPQLSTTLQAIAILSASRDPKKKKNPYMQSASCLIVTELLAFRTSRLTSHFSPPSSSP